MFMLMSQTQMRNVQNCKTSHKLLQFLTTGVAAKNFKTSTKSDYDGSSNM